MNASPKFLTPNTTRVICHHLASNWNTIGRWFVADGLWRAVPYLPDRCREAYPLHVAVGIV